MLKAKTYKYRLYPTKKQVQKLEWTLDMCRILYNSCLLDRRNPLRADWQRTFPDQTAGNP
ncbi:helix-turn-helix domain-containing protein [Thermodesulfovibrio thiophilus]|uniref:helix-turn-helix domain-containing protein n=1 Tax=Thermodesulfovibrio thiophilus TaxID=340095 RepID=UPI000A01B7E5